MKMKPLLKNTVYITLFCIFISGMIFFYLDHFVRSQSEFGDTQVPAQIWVLRIHSVASLWFLFLFGYLFSNHVIPSIKIGKRLYTGFLILALLAILSLSVPALFYITNENIKQSVASIHSYIGFGLVGLFFIHTLAIFHKTKAY